jgi:hypothetical protein
MIVDTKKKWIKPELIVISESEVDENLLAGSGGGTCVDENGYPIPC